MYKYLLTTFMLLLSMQLHASLRQTQYRWRNDDGNETSATWRAAANTPITVSDTSSVLRLRIEYDNNNGEAESSLITETLQYSTDDGATWITLTGASTDPFVYVPSTFVNNLDATTNQMGSATFGTFVAGRIITAPTTSPMSLNDAERTEMEWVIRPTAHIQPQTTYIFQSSDQEDIPLDYPELTTGCVGVYILTKKDSARCGPGTVQLKATATAGDTIKWYTNPGSTTPIATGSTFTTPFLSATTTYYAAAKHNATCESPKVAVTATINPVPVPNLGPDIAICSGDSYTLDPGTYTAYAWDNGATTQTRTVNAAGNYYVTVTGAGNCKGSDTVAVQLKPKPVVNLGPDLLICPGQSATLDAGNPGMSYKWDNNTTAQTRTVNQTGIYFVKVTNPENDCFASDTVALTVKAVPEGILNATHGDTATYTFKVLHPMYAVDYIWNYGDNSPEESGLMTRHTYQSNGIYTVKLTIVGDCDSNITRTRTVDVYDARGGGTGIGNAALEKDFLLYPNPAKEILVIESRSGLQIKAASVYNTLGQKVLTVRPGKTSRYTIDTKALAPGIYLLNIETDKGLLLRKFEMMK